MNSSIVDNYDSERITASSRYRAIAMATSESAFPFCKCWQYVHQYAQAYSSDGCVHIDSLEQASALFTAGCDAVMAKRLHRSFDVKTCGGVRSNSVFKRSGHRFASRKRVKTKARAFVPIQSERKRL
jgi:hypothetical protein